VMGNGCRSLKGRGVTTSSGKKKPTPRNFLRGCRSVLATGPISCCDEICSVPAIRDPMPVAIPTRIPRSWFRGRYVARSWLEARLGVTGPHLDLARATTTTTRLKRPLFGGRMCGTAALALRGARTRLVIGRCLTPVLARSSLGWTASGILTHARSRFCPHAYHTAVWSSRQNWT
jgi:hypothetical protein